MEILVIHVELEALNFAEIVLCEVFCFGEHLMTMHKCSFFGCSTRTKI